MQHRSTATSDHCSLVLHSYPTARNRRNKPRFRFETMWLRDAECKEIIELAWSMPNNSVEVLTIQERIKSCQQQLQWWNKNVFGHINKQLKEKQDKLQHLESLDTLHDHAKDIHLLRKEINSLLDKNTKFFHSTASQRRRKNAIQGLMDDEGAWKDNVEDIERITLDYYTSISTSDQPTQFDAVEQALEPKVTANMNALLTKEFQPKEVWHAI